MKVLLKAAAFALIFALTANVVSAAGVRTFNYSGMPKKEEAPKEEEQPGIKYTPVSQIGLPVETIENRLNQNSPIYYTYEGSRKFTLDFKTPDVSLEAVSSNKALEARARENYLHIENIGLELGDSAIVTLTAKHKDFEPVVQEITITLTNGTPSYPHIISNGDDFLAIRELGLNKNYKQAADISLAGIKEWAVLGSSAAPFSGFYDGGGYKITGMEFSEIDSDYPALFGCLRGRTARITRLNVEGKINTLRYPVNAHGTIVGLLDEGMVDNCSFKGDMALGNSKMTAGGIAAEVTTNGKIVNCVYSGKITASGNNQRVYIGGIAGFLNGRVQDCEFSGEIVSTAVNEPNIGGIVGVNKGSVSSCVAKANLTQYGAVGYVGGVAGYNYSEIKSSAYSGTLYAKGNSCQIGGIAGGSVGSVEGCAVESEVSFHGNDSFAGGIVGKNESGQIKNSSAKANITGRGERSRAGGIVGENYSFIGHENVKVENGSVAVVSGCSFTGGVVLAGPASFVGGIAGRNYGFTSVSGSVSNNAKSLIEKCAAHVISVDATDGALAGRVAGGNVREGGNVTKADAHIVALSENAALADGLINGEEAVKSGAEHINGESLSAEELEGFEKANIVAPEGAKYLEDK